MAQRQSTEDTADFFPTPAWSTRALCEHILSGHNLAVKSCIEPACGAGHMARPLAEYFSSVEAFDLHDYGFGDRRDFLSAMLLKDRYDFCITNPPFILAESFIQKGLHAAREGVAMLVRTSFTEGVGRYNNLFRDRPPAICAQFVERVHMVKGRVDRKASTATAYAWLVWLKNSPARGTELRWIPPCRMRLEREEDYDDNIKELRSELPELALEVI